MLSENIAKVWKYCTKEKWFISTINSCWKVVSFEIQHPSHKYKQAIRHVFESQQNFERHYVNGWPICWNWNQFPSFDIVFLTSTGPFLFYVIYSESICFYDGIGCACVRCLPIKRRKYTNHVRLISCKCISWFVPFYSSYV